MPRFQIVRLQKRLPRATPEEEAVQIMLNELSEFIGPGSRLIELRRCSAALFQGAQRKTDDWWLEALIENPDA